MKNHDDTRARIKRRISKQSLKKRVARTTSVAFNFFASSFALSRLRGDILAQYLARRASN